MTGIGLLHNKVLDNSEGLGGEEGTNTYLRDVDWPHYVGKATLRINIRRPPPLLSASAFHEFEVRYHLGLQGGSQWYLSAKRQHLATLS